LQRLLDADGDAIEVTYRHIVETLARQPGTLGTIFRKAQNRIQDPAKLKRLIVDLIDQENWSATGTDIKGDAYESLLSKGASDIASGAGQYFTPRPLIQAMVDCEQPTVKDSVMDPAAGTAGFLLAVHEHAAKHAETLTPKEREHLRDSFVRGVELVDGTARLAAMNLYLHGIGSPRGAAPAPRRIRRLLRARQATLRPRAESERVRAFPYDELVARDKANLDITWLRDESLEDMVNLPATEVIAREIVEHLTAALVEFEAVAAALEASAKADS